MEPEHRTALRRARKMRERAEAAEVEAIKAAVAAGESYREVAEEVGRNHMTVRDIALGKGKKRAG